MNHGLYLSQPEKRQPCDQNPFSLRHLETSIKKTPRPLIEPPLVDPEPTVVPGRPNEVI